MNIRKLISWIGCLALVLMISMTAWAQGRATLRGSVSDEFGASIVGAAVTLTDAKGVQKTATTGPDGTYSFTGLTPGKYTVHAAAAGFATSENAGVDLATGRAQPVNITLKIATIETQVKVAADTPLSTDTGNNANQQVINGKDLDALPDDPDELAAAIQALAGPSVGPNGGQIYVDGFSGSLPPKEAIREIRINQNPFSPENDQPAARIDILTRPGTDKLRGSASFNFTDESLDTRNPFAVSSSKRAPYQVRQFSGSISGPIVKKKASFFFEGNRNETDDNELIAATVLDSNFNPFFIGQGVTVPRRNTNLSPRLDYAINAKNTLIARYNYFHSTTISGLGGFGLLSKSYPSTSTSQNIQLTETAVINPTTINEVRFQYSHDRRESNGNSTIPGLIVSSSFNGGGSQVGDAINTNSRWELNNFTQIQHGTHTFKFGGRLRGVKVDDISPNNFGGQWVFTGGVGPDFNNPVVGQNFVLTSLERYRRTVLLQQNGLAGLTTAQRNFCGSGTSLDNCIRLLGGGASQFSINNGNPEASVSQTDVGFYWQDDWRIKPNLTFSYGIRYENQTNINSKFNFAPRVAFAWSPGAANSAKPPKTVIRGGAGIFYQRFSENSILTTERFNGITQQQFAVPEPIFKQNGVLVPPTLVQLTDPALTKIYAALNSFQCLTGGPTNCVAAKPNQADLNLQQQAVWQIAPNLQAPAMYLIGGQIEHQLPKNITAYVGVSSIRVLHMSRPRDINAPLPGTIGDTAPQTPTGIRPVPALGDVNQFESSGKMRQTTMFIGFNSRLNPNLSFSGTYILSNTKNDFDGGFPVNSYDLTGEYGRASFDVRHRFMLFGTYTNPKLWKLTFNPFVVMNTGRPFNITTGADTNLDRQFNERPTFAQLNAYCTKAPDRCTTFDYSSTSNDIIPRNYGNGPGSVSINLRVSRTFGFGGEANRSASSSPKGGGDNKTATDNSGRRGGAGGGGHGGPMIGGNVGGGQKGPGGGGPQMMMMGGPGGPGGASKYNLTVSLNFSNILNHPNFDVPVGNLTSPSFGQSLALAGGGFGGFGGFGGNSNGPNRKIYLNLRFTF